MKALSRMTADIAPSAAQCGVRYAFVRLRRGAFAVEDGPADFAAASSSSRLAARHPSACAACQMVTRVTFCCPRSMLLT